MIVHVRDLPMGQIALFNHLTECKQTTEAKLNS